MQEPQQYQPQQPQYQRDQPRWPRIQIRRRPWGVILMSLFLVLQGMFLMVSGAYGMLGLVVLVFDISRGSSLLTHGFISFTLGILSIVFAFGMVMLTRWAFWAAIIVAAFNLVNSLVILLSTHFIAFGHILSTVFSVVVLSYFLLDKNVRAAFSRDAPMIDFGSH